MDCQTNFESLTTNITDTFIVIILTISCKFNGIKPVFKFTTILMVEPDLHNACIPQLYEVNEWPQNVLTRAFLHHVSYFH